MNLLLLRPEQFQSESRVVLTPLQRAHVTNILKSELGDKLRVGLLNGDMGTAQLTSLDEKATVDILQLSTPPPPPLPLTLILALPRPQMIKRILQTVACMGVEKLCLIQTSKVEKSFWQSPSITDDAIREHLILGLEQGVATQLPLVEKFQRFRPFVEDILPTFPSENHKLIAHPGPYTPCPRLSSSDRAILTIGPEGGFTEKEVTYFIKEGFTPIQIGARILKVETAVTALLAKIYH